MSVLYDFAEPLIALVTLLAILISLYQLASLLGWRLPFLVNEPVPVSHKIAVLGLPGSGKTTLITSLFEMIQRGEHVPLVRLHGLETIETVNRYVARLNSGVPVGPTTEKDVFVFRFSYVRKSFVLRLTYDVELADFPGEYSDEISSLPRGRARRRIRQGQIEGLETTRQPRDLRLHNSDLDYTLFHREFFSWIASSREYLFLIDLSSIYCSEDVRTAIADISARVRTSWQVIEDAATERGVGNPRKRAVHIVFTKADSLAPVYQAKRTLSDLVRAGSTAVHSDGEEIRAIQREIAEAGRAVDLADQFALELELVDRARRDNDLLFREMILFFEGRTRTTGVIYTSMRVRDERGLRLGIPDVLNAVLP